MRNVLAIADKELRSYFASPIGYVLVGGLNIDVNGSILRFAAGDGLFIPPGSVTQHRPITITPGTRLLMVEDIEKEER